MNYEKTLDVEVAGQKYQIGQLRATDASWVLAQVLTKMMPTGIEKALASKAGASLSTNRSSLSEEEFNNIQAHALSVVRRYESGNPMPVFVRPNRWAAKDLEYDVLAVMSLTINSIVHNLAPFFNGEGLVQLLESIPGLSSVLGSPTTQQ